MPGAGGVSGAGMVKEWWGRASKKQRRRAAELAIALTLIGMIVWSYGTLAPQVVIVLAFWLGLFATLVQLPFVAGFYGPGLLRPLLIGSVIALPAIIGLAYGALYGRNLFLLWYWEWLGELGPAAAAVVVLSLPALAFFAGRAARNLRKV